MVSHTLQTNVSLIALQYHKTAILSQQNPSGNEYSKYYDVQVLILHFHVSELPLITKAMIPQLNINCRQTSLHCLYEASLR